MWHQPLMCHLHDMSHCICTVNDLAFVTIYPLFVAKLHWLWQVSCVTSFEETFCAMKQSHAPITSPLSGVSSQRVALAWHTQSPLNVFVSHVIAGVWESWERTKLEIWPQRPRYFTATITLHWGEGGDIQGVTSQWGDTSVGGDMSVGVMHQWGRVTSQLRVTKSEWGDISVEWHFSRV